MKRDSGFVLPLTLALMLIVSTLVLYHTERYVSEKRFFFEQSEILKIDTLLQMGMVDLLRDLQEETLRNNQRYVYENGIVLVRIRFESEERMELTVLAKTFQDRQRYVYLNYDKKSKAVTDWVEGQL